MTVGLPEWHKRALERRMLSCVRGMLALPVPRYADEDEGHWPIEGRDFIEWIRGATTVADIDGDKDPGMVSIVEDLAFEPPMHLTTVTWLVLELVRGRMDFGYHFHLCCALGGDGIESANSTPHLPPLLRSALCFLEVLYCSSYDTDDNLHMIRRLVVGPRSFAAVPPPDGVCEERTGAAALRPSSYRRLGDGWEGHAWLTPDVEQAVTICISAFEGTPVPAGVRQRWRDDPLLGSLLGDAAKAGDIDPAATRLAEVADAMDRILLDEELTEIVVARLILHLLTTKSEGDWTLHGAMSTAFDAHWEAIATSPSLMPQMVAALAYLQLLSSPGSAVEDANWLLLHQFLRRAYPKGNEYNLE